MEVIELIVYYVVSPECGPGHRVYTDEDIQAARGIHSIERALETESYWFVRLGKIVGAAGPRGVTFLDNDLAQLNVPPRNTWQIGRRNPGFRRPEPDRRIFNAIFGAFESLLESWKPERDGMVDPYAGKELGVSTKGLLSL